MAKKVWEGEMMDGEKIMTDEEVRELEQWSAKLVGRKADANWHPTDPNNQTWMVVDKMKELGWECVFFYIVRRKTAAKFVMREALEEFLKIITISEWVSDLNPRLAILRAAKEAWELREGK